MDAHSPKPKILHVLSQRPSRTGSGVTLDSMVRCADNAGYPQIAVVGTPSDDHQPEVGELAASDVYPFVFGGDVPFDLPGMSDVMPYATRRWASLTDTEIDQYVLAWSRHLEEVIDRVQPDLIHSHHIWLLSSILKDVAAEIPVVTHCHATGLRQMELCPHLAQRVVAGCRRNDAFCVLHREHAQQLETILDLTPERIHTVAAGYREDLFHAQQRSQEMTPTVVFAGKFSQAKGLPWLLDAVDRLSSTVPQLKLHVAGSGSGAEADALRNRMASMSQVQMHGMLSQAELGALLRRCQVFVLPSMYEGLPLVLVEAVASGCHVVCTALPGVTRELQPALGTALCLVPLPAMRTIDQPDPTGLPQFVSELTTAIQRAIDRPLPELPAGAKQFTWPSVFQRVERIWSELLGKAPVSANDQAG
ncbi:MAG: hypothetical protein CL681_27345 [Blastopirellula sp.]|nr:hypothetical protein [Blastopirellula sp.]